MSPPTLSLISSIVGRCCDTSAQMLVRLRISVSFMQGMHDIFLSALYEQKLMNGSNLIKNKRLMVQNGDINTKQRIHSDSNAELEIGYKWGDSVCRRRYLEAKCSCGPRLES
jgi:hypothetical protein